MEDVTSSGRPRLCHRCQKFRHGCFQAIDDVPYYSVLCAGCLVKCPQLVAEHYAPIGEGASA
jgi:hypothetical protein